MNAVFGNRWPLWGEGGDLRDEQMRVGTARPPLVAFAEAVGKKLQGQLVQVDGVLVSAASDEASGRPIEIRQLQASDLRRSQWLCSRRRVLARFS